jgi:hypothetical protein
MRAGDEEMSVLMRHPVGIPARALKIENIKNQKEKK